MQTTWGKVHALSSKCQLLPVPLPLLCIRALYELGSAQRVEKFPLRRPGCSLVLHVLGSECRARFPTRPGCSQVKSGNFWGSNDSLRAKTVSVILRWTGSLSRRVDTWTPKRFRLNLVNESLLNVVKGLEILSFALNGSLPIIVNKSL